jgi:putative spermidine/putrescine transport system ATP-binding protein
LIQGETRCSANQRNVGMVFQSYALFPNMTVADNVGFGLKIARKPASEIQRTVAEMLDVIHLPDFGSRYPHQLSGGQQQRVALARALAIHPQVLLLDEPLSALDAKIRVELRSEIRRIQRQMAITTIYVTHDQEEALSLSDRIVVMNGGRVEQIGSPFEIYNYPQTAFTASFIGQINLVPAVIVDPAAGIVTVNGQTVRLTPPLTTPAGAGVHIALRPEVLSLRDPRAEQPDDLNTLEGQIEAVDFLGAVVRVRVVLSKSGNKGPDGQSVSIAIDLFNERLVSIPRLGEPVEIVFPPHAGWLIENSGKDQ